LIRDLRFWLQDAKLSTISLYLHHHQHTITQSQLTLQKYEDMHDVLYIEAISCIMYAVLEMHLDIIFSVSFLFQFMKNIDQPHWQVVKCVFISWKEHMSMYSL